MKKTITYHFNIFHKVVRFANAYKFPVFLSILIFLFFSQRLFGMIWGSSIAQMLTISLLVLNGFNLVEVSHHGHLFNRTLGIFTLIAGFLAFLLPDLVFLKAVSFISLFIYLLLISYFLFSQIATPKIVNISEILAAFSGYILIGYIGYFIFQIILLLEPSAFHFSSSPDNEDLIYFSFISMTTIGFGDIVPVNFWAKRVTMILGLTGQFYLTIVIAIFIGKYLTR